MNIPIPALALFVLVAVFTAVFVAYATFRIEKELGASQRLLSMLNTAMEDRIGGNVLVGLGILLVDKLFNSIYAIVAAIIMSVAIFGRRR